MSERNEDAPHPIDVAAGRVLRLARTRAGCTQARLGEKFGISFQQIQKYESGRNRISLSRAYQFAQILRINAADFFGGSQPGPLPSATASPHTDRWLALIMRASEVGIEGELARCAEDIIALADTALRRSPKKLVSIPSDL
jgi:transcriptional regulator with XRE-family HTH domain